VQDGYAADAYVSAGVVDPRGPAGGPTRVVRGGYWRDEARFVRSAMRMRQEPDVAVALIGFRLWRRG
jgi:formylglycine-generating enzyme required for sulfatase activity